MKTISDHIKSILAIIVVTFTYTILVMMIWLFRNDHSIISQILIAIVSGLTGILGYYYGYSQGASKKDEAQAALTASSQTTIITPDPNK